MYTYTHTYPSSRTWFSIVSSSKTSSSTLGFASATSPLWYTCTDSMTIAVRNRMDSEIAADSVHVIIVRATACTIAVDEHATWTALRRFDAMLESTPNVTSSKRGAPSDVSSMCCLCMCLRMRMRLCIVCAYVHAYIAENCRPATGEG